MQLNDFLYNHQYKRKIAWFHYLYTKRVFLGISLIVLYYLFFSTNTGYDGFAYLIALVYMLYGYKKTHMTYKDKHNNNGDTDKNIWLYSLVAKTKRRYSKKGE